MHSLPPAAPRSPSSPMATPLANPLAQPLSLAPAAPALRDVQDSYRRIAALDAADPCGIGRTAPMPGRHLTLTLSLPRASWRLDWTTYANETTRTARFNRASPSDHSHRDFSAMPRDLSLDLTHDDTQDYPPLAARRWQGAEDHDRLPSGWWLLPSAALGAIGWAWLFYKILQWFFV